MNTKLLNRHNLTDFYLGVPILDFNTLDTVRYISNSLKEIDYLSNIKGLLTEDELLDRMNDIQRDESNASYKLQELEKQIDRLEEWGQTWKELALNYGTFSLEDFFSNVNPVSKL